MQFDAQLHTRRWREGTDDERLEHLVDARREQLAAFESNGMFAIVLIGSATMFSVLPVVAIFEAVSGYFASWGPLFKEAYAFGAMFAVIAMVYLCWRQSREAIRALSRVDGVVRTLVELDRRRGAPYVMMDCHVLEEVTTPVKVTLDTDGSKPRLSWEPSGPEQRTTLEIADVGPPPDAHAGVAATGEISLDEASRPGFELTRSASEADQVALTVRAQGAEGVERVSLLCRRPSWMIDADYAALQTLDREGLHVDEYDVDYLLDEVNILTHALGRPIPALATEPVVVSERG